MSYTKVRTPKADEKFVTVIEIRAPQESKKYEKFEKNFDKFKRELNDCVRAYFPGTAKMKKVVKKAKKVGVKVT